MHNDFDLYFQYVIIGACIPNYLKNKPTPTPKNVPITYPNKPINIAGVTAFFIPNDTAIGAETEGPPALAHDVYITESMPAISF